MLLKSVPTRVLFNLLFPIVSYFVFAYPVYRITQWFFGVDGAIGFVGSLAVWALGYGGMIYSFSGPKMIVRYAVVHWMGVSFIFACLVTLAELVRLADIVSNRDLAVAVMFIGIVLTVFAIIVSHHLAVKRNEIFSDKVSRHYRLAQISDVHIGSRQGGFMRRIVSKLNHLEPDCVLITGDLIDSSAVDYEALHSLSEINAKTYFVIGNHERYADLGKILEIAQRLGITTLRQDTDHHHDLCFHGIDDADRRDQVDLHLPDLAKDHTKFNVLLYHRPVGWEFAMSQGMDLMLSGHTHNGQIFPFNYIVKQQFARIRGLYSEGNQHLYVSSGTGTWGPLMRLGSLNEISVHDIKPYALGPAVEG